MYHSHITHDRQRPFGEKNRVTQAGSSHVLNCPHSPAALFLGFITDAYQQMLVLHSARIRPASAAACADFSHAGASLIRRRGAQGLGPHPPHSQEPPEPHQEGPLNAQPGESLQAGCASHNQGQVSMPDFETQCFDALTQDAFHLSDTQRLFAGAVLCRAQCCYPTSTRPVRGVAGGESTCPASTLTTCCSKCRR
jgi:hypothetical protein